MKVYNSLLIFYYLNLFYKKKKFKIIMDIPKNELKIGLILLSSINSFYFLKYRNVLKKFFLLLMLGVNLFKFYLKKLIS